MSVNKTQYIFEEFPDYFAKKRVPKKDESKYEPPTGRYLETRNEPKVVDEVPSDWKDKKWSPQRFTKLLKEIFIAENLGMDSVNLVSDNIHYSELPTLLNNAKNQGADNSIGVWHLASYLLNVAKIRQKKVKEAKEAKKYTDLLGEADRHALWREIGETPSKETLRKSKMNASPAVIYGMVLMLKKLCKRVKDIPEAATEAIKVLTQWISEETLDRWDVSLPQCEKCTVDDVTGFCERIMLGIRRDQLLAIVEMYNLGAGFGLASDRSFDINSTVTHFLNKIDHEVIDQLILTPKTDEHNNTNLYLELMHVSTPPPDESLEPKPLRCNFADGLDDNGQPIQCAYGTQCEWTWGSSFWPRGAQCGCWKLDKWYECAKEKCDHSKCKH